jgi:hypothetical protein
LRENAHFALANAPWHTEGAQEMEQEITEATEEGLLLERMVKTLWRSRHRLRVLQKSTSGKKKEELKMNVKEKADLAGERFQLDDRSFKQIPSGLRLG